MHSSASGHDIRQTTRYSRHARHRLQLPDDHSTVHMVYHASQRPHAIQVDAGQANEHAYSITHAEQAEVDGFQHFGP